MKIIQSQIAAASGLVLLGCVGLAGCTPFVVAQKAEAPRLSSVRYMRVEPITHDDFVVDGMPEADWLEELRADGDAEDADQWPALRDQCAEMAQRELITLLRIDGFKLVKDDPDVTIHINIQEMDDELGGEVVIKNRAGETMYRLMFEHGALPEAPTHTGYVVRDGNIVGARSFDSWAMSFTHPQEVFEQYRSVAFAVRKYIQYESTGIWWMH